MLKAWLIFFFSRFVFLSHTLCKFKLYDFILPFCKKKLHLYPYVFIFFVNFTLGAKFYCNVQKHFDRCGSVFREFGLRGKVCVSQRMKYLL